MSSPGGASGDGRGGSRPEARAVDAMVAHVTVVRAAPAAEVRAVAAMALALGSGAPGHERDGSHGAGALTALWSRARWCPGGTRWGAVDRAEGAVGRDAHPDEEPAAAEARFRWCARGAVVSEVLGGGAGRGAGGARRDGEPWCIRAPVRTRSRVARRGALARRFPATPGPRPGHIPSGSQPRISPDDVMAADLDQAARSPPADPPATRATAARHLVMAGRLLDDDPEAGIRACPGGGAAGGPGRCRRGRPRDPPYRTGRYAGGPP